VASCSDDGNMVMEVYPNIIKKKKKKSKEIIKIGRASTSTRPVSAALPGSRMSGALKLDSEQNLPKGRNKTRYGLEGRNLLLSGNRGKIIIDSVLTKL
jgi:hypothetical protein